jgi:hypothetical protein
MYQRIVITVYLLYRGVVMKEILRKRIEELENEITLIEKKINKNPTNVNKNIKYLIQIGKRYFAINELLLCIGRIDE